MGEMYSSLYTGELGLTPPASLNEGMEPEVADDSSGGVRSGTTPACHRAGILRLRAAAAFAGAAACTVTPTRRPDPPAMREQCTSRCHSVHNDNSSGTVMVGLHTRERANCMESCHADAAALNL